MSLIVQKFGGTSLADPQCIEHVAKKIIATKEAGHQVVAVVSAMSGETERLIGLAKRMQADPTAREYAAILASGEQVSMALLSLALHNKHCDAISLAGHQVKIRTEGRHSQARIKQIDTDKILQYLNNNQVVVIAGFQGVNELGEITTIGRGGSDTSAVAIASALNASECQIFTDVKGVFSADPRIVPNAQPIEEISFAEMLELASLGAKVLQNRAVELAGKYNVPLRVLSTFEEGAGTLINLNNTPMEDAIVSGITYSKQEAHIRLKGLPNTADVTYEVLAPIGLANIGVDMIVHNGSNEDYGDISFTIDRENCTQAEMILSQVKSKIGIKDLFIDNGIGKISVVGLGLKSNAGVASKVMHVLIAENIKIYNIVTSEIKISVLIDEKYIELGVRALHDAFELDKS